MTEVPGWGAVGDLVPDPAPPMPFADWVFTPAATELVNIDAPVDVLRHAWHLNQSIYAADCLHCAPRHVDVIA